MVARGPDAGDCAAVRDLAAVIDALRTADLPYMREHADRLEQQLDQHAPDVHVVQLSLTDVYLRSFNWARLKLGLPLPPDRGM